MGVLVASRANPICKESKCVLEALVEMDLTDAPEGQPRLHVGVPRWSLEEGARGKLFQRQAQG